VLQYVAVCCCRVLQGVAVCCRVLRSVAENSPCIPYISDMTERHSSVCCSILQCVAVFCRVLQYVAGCCSVLPGVAVCCRTHLLYTSHQWHDRVTYLSVLQCFTVCCRVLQYVAGNAFPILHLNDMALSQIRNAF